MADDDTTNIKQFPFDRRGAGPKTPEKGTEWSPTGLLNHVQAAMSSKQIPHGRVVVIVADEAFKELQWFQSGMSWMELVGLLEHAKRNVMDGREQS